MSGKGSIVEFPREADARTAHAYIAGKAKPARRICGVYFLVKGREVVYVGQSIDVAKRLSVHLRQKDFDSYHVIEVPEDRLDEVEDRFIRLLDPRYNGSSPASRKLYSGTRPLHEFVSLYKASEEVDLTRNQLLSMVKAGEIPAPSKLGRLMVYPRPLWEEIKRQEDLTA